MCPKQKADTDILRANFSKYVYTALCNKRKRYLSTKYRHDRELPAGCNEYEMTIDDYLSLLNSKGKVELQLADLYELKATLETLSQLEQEVIILKTFHGLKFHEIACLYGKNSKMAKNTYYRAIAKIRALYTERGGKA